MTFTDAQIEVLARLNHERFRELVAEASQLDVDFAELPADLREVNRASVRAIPEQLATAGYALAPRTEVDSPVRRLPEQVVERIARLEHERWVAHARDRGYRYGATRDDVARTHPDLVPWERLDEAARDKDRALVRAIPDLVEEVGLAVVAVTQG